MRHEGGEHFDKVFDLVGGDQVAELLQSVEAGGCVVSVSGAPTPGSLESAAAPKRRLLAKIVIDWC